MFVRNCKCIARIFLEERGFTAESAYGVKDK